MTDNGLSDIGRGIAIAGLALASAWCYTGGEGLVGLGFMACMVWTVAVRWTWRPL